MLNIDEDYDTGRNGAASYGFAFYDNGTQAGIQVSRYYYYSTYSCSSINKNNVDSRIRSTSYNGNIFYLSSYSGVRCMIAMVKLNVVANASIKAFGIRKVIFDSTSGKIELHRGGVCYYFGSYDSDILSFSDVNGKPFSSVTAVIQYPSGSSVFMQTTTITSRTVDGYNYIQLPSRYHNYIIYLYNSNRDSIMYVGFGNYNPHPNPPQPENKTYIIQQSQNTQFVNPSNNITTRDTIYVYRSVNISKFDNEADFGYFSYMTKYSQQTISTYQASSINTANITQSLQSISSNQYNLYSPSSGNNNYLVIKSQPKTSINTSDKYGINKVYYTQGQFTPHFFFVMKYNDYQTSQIRFGINTDQELPQIIQTKMYTSYNIDSYQNITSNITINEDGNYYQFTNQASDSICILEIELNTSSNLQTSINDNIPYPAPQRTAKIVNSTNTDYGTYTDIQSINQSYDYYILRAANAQFTNESQFKYNYLSSLNSTQEFQFYESQKCDLLTDDNIVENIQELQQDQYGYAYPSDNYNCIILKYHPDKKQNQQNLQINITKTYLSEGVVTNNFIYGLTQETQLKTICIGSYKGNNLPNPYQVKIIDITNHQNIEQELNNDSIQQQDNYTCYNISEKDQNTILKILSNETEYYIVTKGSNPYDSPYHQVEQEEEYQEQELEEEQYEEQQYEEHETEEQQQQEEQQEQQEDEQQEQEQWLEEDQLEELELYYEEEQTEEEQNEQQYQEEENQEEQNEQQQSEEESQEEHIEQEQNEEEDIEQQQSEEEQSQEEQKEQQQIEEEQIEEEQNEQQQNEEESNQEEQNEQIEEEQQQEEEPINIELQDEEQESQNVNRSSNKTIAIISSIVSVVLLVGITAVIVKVVQRNKAKKQKNKQIANLILMKPKPQIQTQSLQPIKFSQKKNEHKTEKQSKNSSEQKQKQSKKGKKKYKKSKKSKK